MFRYFGLVFKGIFSGKFWAQRWNTFLELLKPGEFYSQVGKKEWDTNAYLLGLTVGLFNVIIASFMLGGLISLFSSAAGLAGIAISLLVGILFWVVGNLVLYYIVAWIFAFAAKLITKKNDIEKIRPILFSLAPVGLAGIVPLAGGLISLILVIVLMVIAYEKALKVERGQAVGGSLMGMVFTGALFGLFSLVISGLFLGSLMAGLGGLSAANDSNSFLAQAQKLEAKAQMPDSWGPFEFVHYRSEAQKLKTASDILKITLEYGVKEQYDHELEDSLLVTGYQKLLQKLYPSSDETNNVPTDAYRLAIQQLYPEKADLKTRYFKNYGYDTFDLDFNKLMVSYYNLGKGPANVTVPEVEQVIAKQDEEKKKAEAYSANLRKAFSSWGNMANNNNKTQPGSNGQTANAGTNDPNISVVQPTPTQKSDVLSQVGDAAQKAGAVGDAANTAKKLFGF